jgi:hypothetical protein
MEEGGGCPGRFRMNGGGGGGGGVSPTRSWFFISHPLVFKSPDVKIGLFCAFRPQARQVLGRLVLQCLIHITLHVQIKSFFSSEFFTVLLQGTIVRNLFNRLVFCLYCRGNSEALCVFRFSLNYTPLRVERSTGCALGISRDKILPDRQHRTAFVIKIFM